MRVICINNKDVDLTLRDEYTVIKTNRYMYKVMNDSGRMVWVSKIRFCEVGEC